jgi:hypothetical protein
MAYSVKTGIWKSIKNWVIVLAPSILAFLANLPEEWKLAYAPLLGMVTYFLKNWYENK